MFSKIKLYLVVGIISVIAFGFLINSLIPKSSPKVPDTVQKQAEKYGINGNFEQVTDILKNSNLGATEKKDPNFTYSSNIEDYLYIQNSQTSYYKIPKSVKEKVLLEAKINYISDGPDWNDLIVKKTKGKSFEIVNSAQKDLFVYKDKIYQVVNSYVDFEGFVQGYKTFVISDENGDNKKDIGHPFGDKILKLQVIGDFVYMTSQTFSKSIVVHKVEISTGNRSVVLNSESSILDIFKNLDSSLDRQNRQLPELVSNVKNQIFAQSHYALGSDILLHTSYYNDRFFIVKNGGGDVFDGNPTYKEILVSDTRAGIACKRDDCIIVSKDKILKVNITRGEVATKNLNKPLVLPIFNFEEVSTSSWLRWVGEPEIFQDGKWQKLEL